MVAASINQKGEKIRKASQGVGEAHSTHDVRDSITFAEERGLTVCTPVQVSGGLHSFHETWGCTRIGKDSNCSGAGVTKRLRRNRNGNSTACTTSCQAVQTGHLRGSLGKGIGKQWIRRHRQAGNRRHHGIRDR